MAGATGRYHATGKGLDPRGDAREVEHPHIVQVVAAAEHDHAIPHRVVDRGMAAARRWARAGRSERSPDRVALEPETPHLVECNEVAGSPEYDHPVARRVVDGARAHALPRRGHQAP